MNPNTSPTTISLPSETATLPIEKLTPEASQALPSTVTVRGELRYEGPIEIPDWQARRGNSLTGLAVMLVPIALDASPGATRSAHQYSLTDPKSGESVSIVSLKELTPGDDVSVRGKISHREEGKSLLIDAVVIPPSPKTIRENNLVSIDTLQLSQATLSSAEYDLGRAIHPAAASTYLLDTIREIIDAKSAQNLRAAEKEFRSRTWILRGWSTLLGMAPSSEDYCTKRELYESFDSLSRDAVTDAVELLLERGELELVKDALNYGGYVVLGYKRKP